MKTYKNMNKNLTVSLVITTYNWIEALEIVLLSVLHQTIMPDEIIIADDGFYSRYQRIY